MSDCADFAQRISFLLFYRRGYRFCFGYTTVWEDAEGSLSCDENFNKSQVREGFSMHHKLYKNIKMPMNFVETTFYDENNNNQVWSHLWGWWQGTSRRTGKADIPNPVNV